MRVTVAVVVFEAGIVGVVLGIMNEGCCESCISDSCV